MEITLNKHNTMRIERVDNKYGIFKLVDRTIINHKSTLKVCVLVFHGNNKQTSYQKARDFIASEFGQSALKEFEKKKVYEWVSL